MRGERLYVKKRLKRLETIWDDKESWIVSWIVQYLKLLKHYFLSVSVCTFKYEVLITPS